MNTLSRFQPCTYCCPPCQACKDGNAPAELTASFAGITNGSGACSDCVGANGSWVLQKSGGCVQLEWFNYVPVSRQFYHGAFPGVSMCECGFQAATLVIDLEIEWNQNGIPGQRAITVIVGNSLGCLQIRFALVETGQTEPYDCTNLSSLSIPPVWDPLDPGEYCDWSAGSCQVSS